MKLYQVVARELFQRGSQLWTSVTAVSLGIAAIVAVGSMARFSERAVAEALNSFGAGVLIIPKNAALQDYYSAELGESVIPENYLCILTDSGSLGIDNISAKLSVPVEVRGRKTILTGILSLEDLITGCYGRSAFGLTSTPQFSEFQTGASVKTLFGRIIDDLEPGEAAVGAEIGISLKLKEGDSVDVLGERLTVKALLPMDGTPDDSRIFANIRTVQQLTGYASSLHAIEISGCSTADVAELTRDINAMLPEARVVTVRQVIAAQQQINTLMRRLSLALLIMMALAGAACIANFMFANVDERRPEIGIFMALGADSGWIVKLILMKAAVVGIIGGAVGYIIGTGGAMAFGMKIAGVQVQPVASYVGWSILFAVTVSLLASILPALRAASIDPSSIMKEE
jgi:putative ABC transport system permease protein